MPMLAHVTVAEICIPHFVDPVSRGFLPACLAHAESLSLADSWKFVAAIAKNLTHLCVPRVVEAGITQLAFRKLLLVSTIDAIRYRKSPTSILILVHDLQAGPV